MREHPWYGHRDSANAVDRESPTSFNGLFPRILGQTEGWRVGFSGGGDFHELFLDELSVGSHLFDRNVKWTVSIAKLVLPFDHEFSLTEILAEKILVENIFTYALHQTFGR